MTNASDLVQDILGDIDDIRGIAGDVGNRPFTVTQKRRITNGPRQGAGPFTDINTVLVNTEADGTLRPVMVRQVSRQDIIASGGRYQSADLRVGPMTPAFAAALSQPAGGYTNGQIDSTIMNSPQEIYWLVDGPGLAPKSVFKKVGEEATALHYFIVLRATGTQL